MPAWHVDPSAQPQLPVLEDSCRRLRSAPVISGTAQAVNFSVSGVPVDVTATVSPTSVVAGASATLTVGAGTAAAGTCMLIVTGTGISVSHFRMATPHRERIRLRSCLSRPRLPF